MGGPRRELGWPHREVVRPRGLWITAVAPLKVVIMVEVGSGGKSSDA